MEIPGTLPEIRISDEGPAERLELRILDPPASGRGHVVILTEDSGQRYESYSFDPGDVPTTLPDGRKAQVFVTGPYRAGASFTVAFTAEGYRSAGLGNDEIPPAVDEGLRVAEITPRKGWSALFSVYAVSEEDGSYEELPAIVLTLDGVELPASDASGEVHVETDHKPELLGVATPGWRLVTRTSWEEWGSVFADSGTFTVEDGMLTVFLVATQR